MTITEHLVELKIAKNLFNAGHIATGLKLWELETIEEQVARAKLYRKWRDGGEPSRVAYQNAIDGKEPLELIPE